MFLGRNTISKYSRILSYAKPHWKLLFVIFVLSIFSTILALVDPYLIKILLDDVLVGKKLDLFFLLMGIFVSAFILRTILGIIFSYISALFVEKILLDVRAELFEHLENLQLSFFEKTKLGDILVRINSDVYGIQEFISIILDNILMNILIGVFTLAICLYLNWQITLLALLFFPFYLLIQKYYAKKVKQKRIQIRQKSAEIMSFLQEDFSAIRLIKTFIKEKYELLSYIKKSKQLINLELAMVLLTSYSGAVIGAVTFVPLFLILYFGALQVIEGALTIGALIAIYTYISRLFGPMSSLGSVNIAIQNTMVLVDRLFEFLDKPKIRDKEEARPLKKVKGEIEFQDVYFAYEENVPLLEGISFKIKAGQKIGLIGHSGEGKSTIADLILRFINPSKGIIKIDGKNIEDIKISSLRKNLGIVSQQTILLNTTIKENIRFAKPTATDDEIENVSKLAQVHEFIQKLPNKYDTIVGERGVKLSGGQRQRISIARTLLKDPKILILDEATSSLDSDEEQEIQKAIEIVTKGRTTLVIAHRSSTIKNCDKIVVLKDHKIAEHGNFEELIKNKGTFYKFFISQFNESI